MSAVELVVAWQYPGPAMLAGIVVSIGLVLATMTGVAVVAHQLIGAIRQRVELVSCVLKRIVRLIERLLGRGRSLARFLAHARQTLQGRRYLGAGAAFAAQKF